MGVLILSEDVEAVGTVLGPANELCPEKFVTGEWFLLPAVVPVEAHKAH